MTVRNSKSNLKSSPQRSGSHITINKEQEFKNKLANNMRTNRYVYQEHVENTRKYGFSSPKDRKKK